MQSGGVAKHIFGAMVLAAVIYAGSFAFDQHLRSKNGPWRVTFTQETNGAPAIIVNQPKLGIIDLKIVFAGETTTKARTTVEFDVPQKPAPFGKLKFEDLTYLPGTLTFDCFGHEIELIPRTLYLNRKARPWQSNTTITVTTSEKPASLPVPNPKKR
jgi:hypothetical protein